MAKKKTLLKQMELFDEIAVNKLSPNEYYLLCCMKDSVTPLEINIHTTLRQIKNGGWINEDNKLTPKAQTLIAKIERLFKIQKKKTSTQLMAKDYKVNITSYRELFPNVKLPSGKAARSAFTNLETGFRWFFDNHEYTWATILEATEIYVNEYQKMNWKYMRTAQYFIRKQESDKTFMSELANYCAIVESGGEVEVATFSAKVV